MIEDFKKSCESVKKLKNTPSDEVLLELYGLFKQIEIGNCNIPEPSMWKLKEKKKWQSWKNNLNKNKEDCIKKYINIVNELIKNEK